MCQICDDLGQWVCDCGTVVKLGCSCECGSSRLEVDVGCVTMYLSVVGEPTAFRGRVPNRADRRARRR